MWEHFWVFFVAIVLCILDKSQFSMVLKTRSNQPVQLVWPWIRAWSGPISFKNQKMRKKHAKPKTTGKLAKPKTRTVKPVFLLYRKDPFFIKPTWTMLAIGTENRCSTNVRRCSSSTSWLGSPLTSRSAYINCCDNQYQWWSRSCLHRVDEVMLSPSPWPSHFAGSPFDKIFLDGRCLKDLLVLWSWRFSFLYCLGFFFCFIFLSF